MALTKEQKQEWLEKATNEELLNQLFTSKNWYDNCFEVAERYADQGITVDYLLEDYEMTKAEVLKRMSKEAA